MEKSIYVEVRRDLNLRSSHFELFKYVLFDSLLAATIVCMWVWQPEPWLGVLLAPLSAIFMFRNFSMMHDAVHGAVSRFRLLNGFVGIWCGVWAGMPFYSWRQSHLLHHYWSGNLEKDPVMALAVAIPKFSPRSQSVLTFLWRRWVPIVGGLQQLVFWKLSLQSGLRNRQPSVLFGLAIPVMGWGCLAILAPKFLLWNGLPAIYLYLVLVEVVNFPHHLQILTGSGEDRWPIWRQYETARTCLYPKWFARYVVLNFNYHAEHHMFPEIPWYRLPEVHARVLPLLSDRLNLDESFQWIIENRPREITAVVATPQSQPSSSQVA